MKLEALPRITASHLVKSIDLNHHGTLFAGRMAEWLVEAGFMTARQALNCTPDRLVCVRLHGMDFRKSVVGGETLVMEGRIAYVGRSSITVYVEAWPLRGENAVSTDGFVSFVHIMDERATPHGLEIEPPTEPEAKALWDLVVAERQRR